MSLAGRSLSTLCDFTTDELTSILDLAARVKKSPKDFAGALSQKTLAMIFQKPSLRTRVSFETGMTQMGGHAIYLSPNDISLGKRETTEDIAIVLSRYADLIMARVFGHDIIDELTKHATVPVINGLSDYAHPCQMLADLQTVQERKGAMKGLKFVYSGDGNNVAHSIMFGGALVGMHVVIVTPPGYEPNEKALAQSREMASKSGGSVEVTNDLSAAAQGADVLYTDVWASMGQEDDAERRRQFFMPYQVNMDILKKAKGDCVFLHCLPAHYDEEVTYDVTRSPNSAIFDQAENRMHAQKALMLKLAGAA